jgi:carbamoyltransferase
MKIFGAAVNIHDHNTYDGELHHMAERYTRRKHNLNYKNPHDPSYSREFFNKQILPRYKNRKSDEIFSFTVSNLGQQFVIDIIEDNFSDKEFLDFQPENLWDYMQKEDYYYIDHHQSHAAYAFLSSGYKESDILAIDGRGWKFNCIFIGKDGKIINLTDKVSIGGLWNRLSQDIGFSYLDAGKTMGLAGFGGYDPNIHNMIDRYLDNANDRLPDEDKELVKSTAPEDVAFTLQLITQELIKKYVVPLKTCDNLCIAGGVAYNGYANEELTKFWNNVHVPPAAGDEGQSIGAYMHADYTLNKNIHVPSVYAGEEYEVNTKVFGELYWERKPADVIATEVAHAISNGKIVGWYQGKGESGNRALGNRSILADPRNPDIKNIINTKIKLREDFRPFAPSVLEEYYQEYFDTNQPSPYMSRIMPVKSDKIPGVTHVDGTARIQTVQRDFNTRYYDLINEFYLLTGIPMLLNTSFNCQEPIVETPEDAVNTFKKCGLDLLVINNYIVRKEQSGQT